METMNQRPETAAGTKRVLVVEDDHRIREIVSRILHANGFLTIEASDGLEALKQAESADIVLLDLFIPGVSGDEFMRQIRGNGNYVPVVVMSAVLDREDAVKNCKQFGIVDFMEKPFKAGDLVGKIKKAAGVADDLRFVRKATDRVKGFIERQAQV